MTGEAPHLAQNSHRPRAQTARLTHLSIRQKTAHFGSGTPRPDRTGDGRYNVPDVFESQRDWSNPVADEVQLLDALKQVIDPELMVNIVDLGLVYDISQDERTVNVDMTLTSPACPAGPQIMQQSKMALEQLEDVDEANIKLVMSPPWTPERMTDDARDQLGIF